VKVVDEGFDLGAGGPILHLDSVDDRRLLHHLFILFNIRLLKVDTERNVTDRAVRVF
jgi:hypothetical protein